jgi:hypothetical protein
MLRSICFESDTYIGFAGTPLGNGGVVLPGGGGGGARITSETGGTFVAVEGGFTGGGGIGIDGPARTASSALVATVGRVSRRLDPSLGCTTGPPAPGSILDVSAGGELPAVLGFVPEEVYVPPGEVMFE